MKASKDDLEKTKAKFKTKSTKKAKVNASLDEDNFDDVEDSNDGDDAEPPENNPFLEFV
jgi:hypothetical protein